jgi:nifR3 family TIM-barrel protein
MAEAAQVVASRGADIVDVNMGCPVPKVAKHDAGCSLMRDPAHAARIVSEMTKAVRIPVTVKMRAGWNDREVNAPELAKMLENAGAAAIAVHGRTAADSYRGRADWDLIARVADSVSIPVFGNGDLIEPADLVARWRSSGIAGVLIGRGVLRNPWILAQALDLASGAVPKAITPEDRCRFLLEYIDLLLGERVNEPAGFRHEAMSHRALAPALGRERWVINKLRALAAWFTKGLDNGSQLRVAVNRAESIVELRETITGFFECQVRAEPSQDRLCDVVSRRSSRRPTHR